MTACHHIGKLGTLLFLLGSTVAGSLLAEDRILIQGKLNGQPLKLAVDTGAGELVIFRTVADQRHLNVVSPPANSPLNPGEVLLSRTEGTQLELFGQILSDVRLGVVDSPSAVLLDTDGVIGWSSIRSNIWLLSGSTLKFSPLEVVPPASANWTKLREAKDSPTLCLEVAQGKAPPVYIGIDTGADSGVRLSADHWAKWRATHPRQPVTLDAYFMPGSGLVIAEEAWADEIDVGGLVLRGVPVTSMNPIETIRLPPGAVAVFGLTAMKRMDTVFDGPNAVAYLHPLNSPPPPYAHNRLGAVFVPATLESSDLIAHVAVGGPAARAGVRNGDQLLMIDDVDVTTWRTDPATRPGLRFRSRPAGTKFLLQLKRGGKILTLPVQLEDIVSPQARAR